MKNVVLITGADLGDNLSELLSLQGYSPFLLNNLEAGSFQKVDADSDLLICEEEFLKKLGGESFHSQSPTIVLTNTSLEEHQLSRNFYLLMPFSDRELFDAILRSSVPLKN